MLYKYIFNINKNLINTKNSEYDLFYKICIFNILIHTGIWHKKIIGKKYIVPYNLTEKQKISKSIKFLIKLIKKYKNKQILFLRLKSMLLNAYNKQEDLLKLRSNIHKLAKENIDYYKYGTKRVKSRKTRYSDLGIK